jgi:hypothetical protein
MPLLLFIPMVGSLGVAGLALINQAIGQLDGDQATPAAGGSPLLTGAAVGMVIVAGIWIYTGSRK